MSDLQSTIIMGAVSDRLGRRKAFISVGYLIWGVSIIAFAYIKSVTLTIVMDCVMTFFGSTANDAAYNAWITDRGVEEEVRTVKREIERRYGNSRKKPDRVLCLIAYYEKNKKT